MDFRPATQASTGRHLLRSAIAEAVASDPAQRVVASTGSAGLAQPNADLGQPNADLGGPRRRGRPHRRCDHWDHAADRDSAQARTRAGTSSLQRSHSPDHRRRHGLLVLDTAAVANTAIRGEGEDQHSRIRPGQRRHRARPAPGRPYPRRGHETSG